MNEDDDGLKGCGQERRGMGGLCRVSRAARGLNPSSGGTGSHASRQATSNDTVQYVWSQVFSLLHFCCSFPCILLYQLFQVKMPR